MIDDDGFFGRRPVAPVRVREHRRVRRRDDLLAAAVEARAQGRLPRLSPRIGDGFGVNGDFLTIRANPREDFGAVQGGPGYARIYEDNLPGGPVSMVYQATPLPAPLGKSADAVVPLRYESQLARESTVPAAASTERTV